MRKLAARGRLCVFAERAESVGLHPAGVGKHLTDLTDAGLDLQYADTADPGPCLQAALYDAVIVHIPTGPGFPLALNALRAARDQAPATPRMALLTPDLTLQQCQSVLAIGVQRAVRYASQEDWFAVLAELGRLCPPAAHADQPSERRGNTLMRQLGLAGTSEKMADLLERAEQAASVSDVPILIHGESGTGKQKLAEAIHRMDPKRAQRPFVSVNCAAIAGTLAESSLFGHVKGAFTGATENRHGYFRAADGGTLLLDEVSELELSLQGKLLRVLQEGLILPVGSDKEVRVDVRIVAASNRDLLEMVQRREFRLDLYQRLNVIPLQIPALRERPEDIAPLVQMFLQRYRSYSAMPVEEVDARLLAALPLLLGEGNVRELENLVRQMLVFKRDGRVLDLCDLPPAQRDRLGSCLHQPHTADARLSDAACPTAQAGDATRADVLEHQVSRVMSGAGLDEVLSTHERELLSRLIRRFAGKTADQVAAALGMPRRTFYHRLKRHSLSLPRGSAAPARAAGPHTAEDPEH